MKQSSESKKMPDGETPEQGPRGAQTGFDTPEPLWIDSRSGLENFLDEVQDATFVGMDLEADNLHSYREKLCLIQLAADGRVALIDPLAFDDCSPLLEFIDDERRDLWMHGADFDMTLMLGTFDWLPHRIRDTQIAAQLVGCRQFGLASLVKNFFGIEISKSSQKQDWSKRPLTPKMLEYAAADAALLLPLKEQLMARLVELGRLDWFEESCSAARRQVLARPPRDTSELWRISGSGALRGRQLAILRALWHWRENEACRRDVPTFKVISNQELLDLSRGLDEGGRPEIRRRLTAPARRELSELIPKVLSLPEREWPERQRSKRSKRPKDFEEKVDQLKALRDAAAARLDIDPSVIAARKTLESIVLGEHTETNGRLLEWQRELLGPEGPGSTP